MSEEFKVEIVNPEKSFLVKEDVSEVVVPAFEGEMGILKDHISIISFLKPGIIKILSKSGDEKEINIKTKNPEFLDWKWIDLDQITEVVVDFKLHVYKELQEKVKKIIN